MCRLIWHIWTVNFVQSAYAFTYYFELDKVKENSFSYKLFSSAYFRYNYGISYQTKKYKNGFGFNHSLMASNMMATVGRPQKWTNMSRRTVTKYEYPKATI